MCIAAERRRGPVRSALNSVVLEIPCSVFVGDVLRASPLVNADVTWMDHNYTICPYLLQAGEHCRRRVRQLCSLYACSELQAVT